MMKAKTSPWILILLLFVGGVVGSLLWALVTPYLPEVLGRSLTVGSTAGPLILDLDVFTLTIGLVLKLNIGSMLGMIVAAIIYWRL